MLPSEVFKKRTGKAVLFNIQHINNISSIMEYGLLSHELVTKLRIQHEDIASMSVQWKRAVKRVNLRSGMMLHQYASVYFNGKNIMLYDVLDKHARDNDICLLEIDPTVLNFAGTVVTDRNAASASANFYTPEDGLSKLNFCSVYSWFWVKKGGKPKWTMINEEWVKIQTVMCAEVLVPEYVDYDYVIRANVANLNAYRKLKQYGFDKEINIEPKLFFY